MYESQAVQICFPENQMQKGHSLFRIEEYMVVTGHHARTYQCLLTDGPLRAAAERSKLELEMISRTISRSRGPRLRYST